jgi:hypothetical protein
VGGRSAKVPNDYKHSCDLPIEAELVADIEMIFRLDTTWTLHVSGAHFSTVVGTPGPFSFLREGDGINGSRGDRFVYDIIQIKQ